MGALALRGNVVEGIDAVEGVAPAVRKVGARPPVSSVLTRYQYTNSSHILYLHFTLLLYFTIFYILRWYRFETLTFAIREIASYLTSSTSQLDQCCTKKTNLERVYMYMLLHILIFEGFHDKWVGINKFVQTSSTEISVN